jgi:hypothetical protein
MIRSQPIETQAIIRPAKLCALESLLIVILFISTIVCLGTIFVAHAIGKHDSIILEEKRLVAALPSWHWSTTEAVAFSRQFEKFYNDRFPFRIDLISFISYLKYEFFDVSWLWSVAPGDNGWLFFLGKNGLETIRHTPVFSQQELKAWALNLEERRQWLASRHIQFLLVIAPYKASVYPEYVPESLRPVDSESRCGQLLKYLKEHTLVETVDLRQQLIAAKNQGPLYFKTDSHWNRLGAFIAYQAITTKLHSHFPAIQPLKFDNLKGIPNVEFEGDLAQLIAIQRFVTDRYTEYSPKEGFAWQLSSNPPAGKDRFISRNFVHPFATEVCRSDLPSAYFIRDSFMCCLQPFLSQHFRRAYFEWIPNYSFNARQIELEHPDVVVQEMAENHLFLLPPNPAELKAR